jgi:hypothetical protein
MDGAQTRAARAGRQHIAAGAAHFDKRTDALAAM